MVLETEKSHQDLQSASWRPRRADGLVSVYVWVQKQKKTQLRDRQRDNAFSFNPFILSGLQ